MTLWRLIGSVGSPSFVSKDVNGADRGRFGVQSALVASLLDFIWQLVDVGCQTQASFAVWYRVGYWGKLPLGNWRCPVVVQDVSNTHMVAFDWVDKVFFDLHEAFRYCNCVEEWNSRVSCFLVEIVELMVTEPCPFKEVRYLVVYVCLRSIVVTPVVHTSPTRIMYVKLVSKKEESFVECWRYYSRHESTQWMIFVQNYYK